MAGPEFILLVLVLVSSYLAFRKVYERFTSVKLKSYKLAVPDDVPARIWNTLAEVLLQSKVMANRPIVGLMHALVMWGFIVFGFVTFRHVLAGFTNPHTLGSIEYGWYGNVSAFWAVLVLLGIGHLFLRRALSAISIWLGRPFEGAEYLGKYSPISGVIAFLIVVLMVTFLVDWAGLIGNEAMAYANWWIHTVAVLLLLVVIPRSKHLHLLLAPVAIFFRPETTSKMKPLDLEKEELGLIKFEDLSAKDAVDLNACVECGRCTEACPVNLSGGSLSPKAIILDMQKGFLAKGDTIVGPWVDEKDLFQCLSCGACEQVCPVGIEHVGSKILDLRRGLVSEGKVTNEKVLNLFTTMEREPHNPWGVSQSMRRKFVEKEGFPIFDGSQKYLFWLGCGLSYDPDGQKVAKDMKKIFNANGESWGVLESETCCGHHARQAGNEGAYLDLSQKLIDKFAQSGVKNIITCCPHCTTTLDNDYRQSSDYQNLGIKVVHHTEFLKKIAPRLELKPEPGEVTYHDPCYLARGRSVTEEPRSVLNSCGRTVKEMKNSGKDTFCCGAGGGQIFVADDKKDKDQTRVNHLRFIQVQETGAKKVVVACTYCQTMLKDAANHFGSDIAVVNIAEEVAERLQQKEGGRK